MTSASSLDGVKGFMKALVVAPFSLSLAFVLPPVAMANSRYALLQR
jgi:hypothetical protein